MSAIGIRTRDSQIVSPGSINCAWAVRNINVRNWTEDTWRAGISYNRIGCPRHTVSRLCYHLFHGAIIYDQSTWRACGRIINPQIWHSDRTDVHGPLLVSGVPRG